MISPPYTTVSLAKRWGWLRRLFPVKKAEPEMVWSMCNNCFAEMYVPAGHEWWCTDCEGKFHPAPGREPRKP